MVIRVALGPAYIVGECPVYMILLFDVKICVDPLSAENIEVPIPASAYAGRVSLRLEG